MTRQLSNQTQQQTATTSPLSSGILQRKCVSCGQHTIAGGECEGCQKKRSPLQRRSANQAEPAEVPPIVGEVLRSPGQPLDSHTRAFMEPRFKRDFSGVRVHTDARAAESARAVNALAYTIGRNVVFGAGKFAPQIPSGQKLLAHELTHVIQQGNNSTSSLQRLTIGSQNSLHENEAERAANFVIQGKEVPGSIISQTPIRQFSLQRACDFSLQSNARCTQRLDESVFDITSTGESLFLFEKDCDLFPDYEKALKEFATSITQNTLLEVHGFSSNQEFQDFSCPRALKAQSILLEQGISPAQIALYAHSATPGSLGENSAVAINLIGSRAVAENQTSKQEKTKQSAAHSSKSVDTTSNNISQEYTEPGWESVNQLGIVAKITGVKAKLRRDASTSKAPLHELEGNTKVDVIAENKKNQWVYIKVINKQYQGAFGYIANWLVWKNPPDPDAVLHYVQEGENLQKLVENHEQYKDYDIRTGDDSRSLSLAVYLANNQDSRTKGNVYINQEKLEKAQDPGLGEKIKDRLDEYRRVLRPIFQSVELRAGTEIWLPGKSYVKSLKDRGIIPTRSELKNAAIATGKGISGFASGLKDGFVSSVLDVFVGIYDLVKSIVSLAIDILSGEAIKAAEELYDLISEMSAEELLKILVNAIAGLADELFTNFANSWNANSPYQRWYFRGKVIGYILAEVLMAIFSGGAATATKLLGRLGKIGSKLAKIMNKALDTVENLPDFGKFSKNKISKSDVVEGAQEGSKEAKEFPIALGLAKGITELHDEKDSSVSLLKTSLLPIKKKFNWITNFDTSRVSPGHYQVFMIGSRYIVDRDYTTEVEEVFAEASQKGVRTEKPEGTNREISPDTARVKVVHDIGVAKGKIKAVSDGLSPNNPKTGIIWENPYEFDGSFGRGIDDIMFDKNGNPVILEYKGGTSQLNGDQMQKSWVCRKIAELKKLNDPMANLLETSMAQGNLKGRIYRTPVDEQGQPGKPDLDGKERDYKGKC